MKYDFDYKKKWKDVISEEEFNQLKDELRLELDDFENHVHFSITYLT